MMDLDLSKIEDYFTMESFRDGQRECIEFILESFNSGKRFVILEAPTGSGKSAIGLTIARFFQKTFYLTIQKILQSQIVTDFSDKLDIVDLKGRNAYSCLFYNLYGRKLVKRKGLAEAKLIAALEDRPDCNNGYCRKRLKKYRSPLCFPEKDKSFKYPSGMGHCSCPYYEQVYKAMAADVALMNFSSFLYQTRMTKRWGSRDLLIIDEAHQAESQLLDFISLTVSDDRLQNLGFKLHEFDTPEEYWLYFIENKLAEKIGKIVMEAREADDVRTLDTYGGLLRKLTNFMTCMEEDDEWVAEFIEHKKYNSVKLKPVFVGTKSYDYLLDHGTHVLMMSATILNTSVFCNALGISRKHVAAYRMANRFPVKSRPIYYRPAAKIVGGKSKMGNWGPKLMKAVDEIVGEHVGRRGIVHTHNFAIAEMLMKQCKFRSRFLFQRNFRNKDIMLKKHAESVDTVIVAPAMHEGLDLVDDLSRFQIICKVPWPNLYEDKQLSRRVELDRKYYLWLTALKLVQSSGRSVRSMTDWADTFVLDEVFRRFLDDAADMIPSWFREAVIFGDKL